jgi:hypothetical protein
VGVGLWFGQGILSNPIVDGEEASGARGGRADEPSEQRANEKRKWLVVSHSATATTGE